MTRRVASRYDWARVTPPDPFGGTHSTAVRYYVANPMPELALNAWRSGGYWRWGILAFVDGTALIFRQGSAPTLGEAKLRAESALPDAAHPQTRVPWDGMLPDRPTVIEGFVNPDGSGRGNWTAPRPDADHEERATFRETMGESFPDDLPF